MGCFHADKDIHVLASLFETMPDSPMSKLSQVIEQSGLAPEACVGYAIFKFN
jgi:hypothetical protein